MVTYDECFLLNRKQMIPYFARISQNRMRQESAEAALPDVLQRILESNNEKEQLKGIFEETSKQGHETAIFTGDAEFGSPKPREFLFQELLSLTE